MLELDWFSFVLISGFQWRRRLWEAWRTLPTYPPTTSSRLVSRSKLVKSRLVSRSNVKTSHLKAGVESSRCSFCDEDRNVPPRPASDSSTPSNNPKIASLLPILSLWISISIWRNLKLKLGSVKFVPAAVLAPINHYLATVPNISYLHIRPQRPKPTMRSHLKYINNHLPYSLFQSSSNVQL